MVWLQLRMSLKECHTLIDVTFGKGLDHRGIRVDLGLVGEYRMLVGHYMEECSSLPPLSFLSLFFWHALHCVILALEPADHGLEIGVKIMPSVFKWWVSGTASSQ